MKNLRELSSLDGRVALITGGAGHLGFAMADALAESGAQLVLLDLDERAVEEAAQSLTASWGGEHRGIAIDLSSQDAIEQGIAALEASIPQLDVLINCASLVGSSGLKGWAVPFEQQSVETWRKALEVNLTAGFTLIQRCLGMMKAAASPSIINIASIYGVSGQKMFMYDQLGYLTPAAYSASKGGIVQMTRYLATVLAPHIRVNCISPGGIERGQDVRFQERYVSATPLGRMATEEDFKGVTQFLASDLSAYVTGQNLIVDGGWSL